MLSYTTGFNNYQQTTYNKQQLITTFNEQPISSATSLRESLQNDVKHFIDKKIAVLFSGGIDSEVVITTCLDIKANFYPVFMLYTYKKMPVNTHELYHATTYCREHCLELKIIELDLEWFFEQDHYLSYAQKYLCNIAIITPYLWAIDQIDDCLILGGDAPHITKLNPITFFPPLLGQTSVERMFNANNRTGIPNFLTHSLSSMCFGLQLWQQALLGVTCSVPFPRWAYAITKHKMYTTGGFDTLQIKPKYSSAFALLADLNMRQYDSKLTSIMPHCYSNIIPCESMIRCINQAQ